MQGLGIISLCDTWVPLVPPNFFLFEKKTACKGISVEQDQMNTFHWAKLQYWNSFGLWNGHKYQSSHLNFTI